MLQKSVIEILSTQMGITSGSLDGKNTAADIEERNIEGSSSEIENQHVLLRLGLAIETVSDGGGSGFIDNTENI